MAATLDDNIFYGLKETLDHVLKREEFPLIVRVCEDFINTTMEGRAVIHGGEELLITGRRTVELGRVRVLDVLDEEAARKAHNDDFVADRRLFVGEEYLLPLKVPYRLKFVHRPGKTRRYAAVSQVIKDMPRRLHVDKDVMSVSPGGTGQNILIPRGTVLNVKRVFSYSLNKEKYLQCTFGTQNVSFKESMRVKFTAVDDDSEYTLAYIQKSNILPSVFEFICPKQNDVVHFENDIASCILAIAEGPLELSAIIKANVLVCWKREKKIQSYSTVVIPVSLENTIAVQQRKFEDANFKASYIEKRYCECSGSDFIETGLFMINPNQMGVAYLKSPNLYVYDGGRERIRTPRKGIRYNVSSDEGSEDDGDDDYYDIGPPLPDRIPHLGDHEHKIPVQTRKKKKSIFQTIQDNLKHIFSKKHALNTKHQSHKVARAKHTADEHKNVYNLHLPLAVPKEQERQENDTRDDYDDPNMDVVMAGNCSDGSDSPGVYEIPESIAETTTKTSIYKDRLPLALPKEQERGDNDSEVEHDYPDMNGVMAGSHKPPTREEMPSDIQSGYRSDDSDCSVVYEIPESLIEAMTKTSTNKYRMPLALPKEQEREDINSGAEHDYPDMRGVVPGIHKPLLREELPSDKHNGYRSDGSDCSMVYEIPESRCEATTKPSSYKYHIPLALPKEQEREDSNSGAEHDYPDMHGVVAEIHKPALSEELPSDNQSGYRSDDSDCSVVYEIPESRCETTTKTSIYKYRMSFALPTEQERQNSDSGDEYDYLDMQSVIASKQRHRPTEQLPSHKRRSYLSDDSDSSGNYEIPVSLSIAKLKTSTSSDRSDEPTAKIGNTCLRELSLLSKADTIPSPPILLSTLSSPVEPETLSSEDIYCSDIEVLEDNIYTDIPLGNQTEPESDEVSERDMNDILQPNQTEEDFYKLTVMQLSQLMNYCYLEHIGTICYDKRLDGEFFRGIDLKVLKLDPFNATGLEVTKFRHILHGWRPILE